MASIQNVPPDALKLAKGRFAVVGRLSRGPISSTFRAQDLFASSARAVALLRPDLAGSAEVERFQVATQAWADIEHPHLVQIFDLGEARGGVPFAVLEDLVGSLAAWFDRGGPMPPRSAGMIAVQLVDALTAIHGAGLVHGRVGPMTLWLAGGVVKLGDLELVVEQGAPIARASSPFRPPDEPATADPRIDLYGVGATLVSLLLGAVPQGKPDPDAIPGVHPALVGVMRRCLARSNDRYPGADQLAEDLLEALSHVPDDPQEPDLRRVAVMTSVDKDAPDLAPAIDVRVDPHHPMFRDGEQVEDKPAWMASPAGSPSGSDLLRSTPLPEPPPSAVAPKHDPTDKPPNTDPWAKERAAKALLTPQPEARAESPKPAPRIEPPKPASPKPTLSSEPEEEGGRSSAWLAVLIVPLLGAVAVIVAIALAVVITLGTGMTAVNDGADETARAMVQLYRTIDDQRRVVDQLSSMGGDRASLEQGFIRYMEQRSEPAKLQAAMAFVAEVESEDARVTQGEDGASPVGEPVRKLRLARQAYEDAVAGWHAAAASSTGRLALSMGLGSPPDR